MKARVPPSALLSARVTWAFCFVFGVFSLAGCAHRAEPARPASEPNLLLGHELSPSAGVVRPDQAADGVMVARNDNWDVPQTTILRSPDDALVYDLGSPQPIEAAFIQADNNDPYTLSGSIDGQTFTPFWVAPPVDIPGLQTRYGQKLHTRARYVRVTAAGGDGAYSIAEVQVYSAVPSAWPSPPVPADANADAPNATTIEVWAAACAVFLLFGCYGTVARGLAFAVLPVLSTYWLVEAIAAAAPAFNPADICVLRAVTAALALLAILRQRLALGHTSLDRRRVTAMMALLAVAGVACFYNLGRPQFYDAKLRKPSYVHNYDMRVYFPVAKYFHELRYDGLYLASVASYVDNHPGTTLQTFAEVELRDLTNHQMRRVKDVYPQIDAVRERFSAPRWAEFRTDMAYFQDTMGRDYFGTMIDHGGNATPVWLTIANFLFRSTHASNAVLLATGSLDPLLLLLLSVVVTRVYGLRTALLLLVLFGANDYYLLGTTWGGSTLRHDWMVALGLGAAALRSKRFALGGALLAYGGLIRAFPALAVFALLGPPIWWLVEARVRLSRFPSPRELYEANRGAVHALGSAFVTVVLAVGISSLVLSPEAWPLWLHKASVLSAGDHVNNISLRTIASLDFDSLAGGSNWSRDPGRLLFFAAAAFGFGVLTIKALRQRSLEVACVLGLILIPVLFYPANYYSHVVFLLPLLAKTEAQDPRDRAIWSLLCLMCVAEFATTHARSLGSHFMGESFVLLGTYLALLFVMIPDTYEKLSAALQSFGQSVRPRSHAELNDDEDDEDDVEEEALDSDRAVVKLAEPA